MHILYLHQYFVPPDGSGGTRSYEMARRMVRAGHRVTMITSSAFFPAHYDLGEAVSDLEIEGISLRVIQVPYSNKLGNVQRIKAFAEFALKAMREAARVPEVDVIFATSTPLTIAFPGIYAKIRHGKPMVFEVRDLWPELPIAIGALKNPLLKTLARWLERVAYKNSAHVVALSPGMKEGVVGSGYPEERVSVVPNSCDVDLFGKKPLTDYFKNIRSRADQPVVLYAGTFGPINGVDYLVDLAARMLELNPDVLFAVVGDGKQKQEVLARAREKKVLDVNLFFIPPVAKSVMPDVLNSCTVACSLFVNLPPMWHNSANKFFDALAAGKPIMINYGGWQAEVIGSSGAGLAVPPEEPATAAERLHRFLQDPQRLEEAGTVSARLAATDFNRDNLFVKLLHALESVHLEKRR